MPHVFAIATGAIVLFYGIRWIRRELERVESSLKRADRRISRNLREAPVPLILDTATGIYAPAQNFGQITYK